MRRIVLSLLFAGVVAPLAPRAHAQTGGAPSGSPTVTASPATAPVGGTATVQGAGFTPDNYAFVYWQRPDGTTNGTHVSTDAAGTFTLTLGFDASHGMGAEFIAGYDYEAGVWSAFFTITVTSGTPPPAAETLAASPNPVLVGNVATITGSGFSPDNDVSVQWTRPDGTTNATDVATDSTGAFSFQLEFLPSHGCGTETLQADDDGSGTQSAPYAITVACQG